MLKDYRLSFRLLVVFVFVLLLMDAAAGPVVFSQALPKTTFSLGPGGADLGSSALRVAVYLNNTGKKPAPQVVVQSIAIKGATLLTSVPIQIGEINVGGGAIVNADFSNPNFAAGRKYELSVAGTYVADAKELKFRAQTQISIPPGAPGSATGKSRNAVGKVVSGGKFKPIMKPENFDEANERSSWVVPIGPLVPVTPTAATRNPSSDLVSTSSVPSDPPVTFLANDSENLPSGPFNGDAGTIAEPSGGANTGGIIFSTANWLAAYSTNGGESFTSVNPTTIFPADAVGYCCDQIVQYAPTVDRFIWLLQGNGIRIAEASPATVKSSGATAWTYWALTPQFFGLGKGASLDYPHVSLGTNDLYISIDQIGVGLIVARISLAQIAAGGTINVGWTSPSSSPQAYSGTVTQNTGTEVFWAGQNSTSSMRIFSWPDSTNTYSWQDIGIGSWSNTGLSSITPDNIDWMTKLANFPASGVIGATRQGNNLWFAWSAGTDNNFPQPHIEMVELDSSNNYNLLQQVQIWGSDYAYGYPTLATNGCTGEIGFSLEGGGNGNYENHLVGFWGDFFAYTTTDSDVGTQRFGDYVTIRQDPGYANSFFDAFGYGLNKGTVSAGTQTDVHYVLFGRGKGDSCEAGG